MLEKVDNKKTYYPISEVCKEAGLEQHVLRYWETEFPQLKPKKNRAGNRAYRQKDIQLIKLIKFLLYEEHYTIQGAKKKLSEMKHYDIETQMKLPIAPAPAQAAAQTPDASALKDIKKGLEEVLRILKG